MPRFRQVEDAFRQVCQDWGYQEIRTPTLEYLYLFTAAGTLTPGMLRRVYSFLDWDGWSGERVVLKPDATIPAARLYIEQLSDSELVRLCYVANTFIFEETGAKNRERWQCGAELIGSNIPLADAELVALTVAVLKKLELKDIEIRLSHAGLIRSLLAGLGLNCQEQASIMDEVLDGRLPDLDRLKSTRPELLEALKLLFGVKGKSPGFLRNIKALCTTGTPEFQTALDNFIAQLDLIEQTGVAYQIDMSAGKGFEYYTGLIFRLFVGGQNVGGGGRYDQLIPIMGGPPVPAAGFALYMDQLMELACRNKAAERRVAVLIDEGYLRVGLELADKIRQTGQIVELAMDFAVEINSVKPNYSVTDCLAAHTVDCDTPEQVLAQLGRS
jgi:histidyl-tRNA synthetase